MRFRCVVSRILPAAIPAYWTSWCSQCTDRLSCAGLVPVVLVLWCGGSSCGCLLGRSGGPGWWCDVCSLRAAFLVQLGLWVAVSCGVVVSRGCGASPRGLCCVVVWFSPGFFHNKPGTFCLIKGEAKLLPRFRKKSHFRLRRIPLPTFFPAYLSSRSSLIADAARRLFGLPIIANAA